MQEIRVMLGLLVAMLIALTRAMWHRIRHGPMVPSWSWSMELRVVALRDGIGRLIHRPHGTAIRRAERRMKAPLPLPLRKVMQVEPDTVGGRRADWLSRVNPAGRLRDVATILYFHGGGYVMSGTTSHRQFGAHLAWAARSRLVLVDYRVAPEDPFPAAVEDAIAAYADLLARGIDPASIIVAGDSAGGGLTLALLLAAGDRGLPLPAGAVVFSAYTDLTHTGASWQTNAATDYLPPTGSRPNTVYLDDHDPTDPLASPLYGDFTGSPPILAFAGGREMLLDDSTRLASRLEDQGVPCDLVIEPDMPHVWPAIFPEHPASKLALATAAQFIQDRCAN